MTLNAIRPKNFTIKVANDGWKLVKINCVSIVYLMRHTHTQKAILMIILNRTRHMILQVIVDFQSLQTMVDMIEFWFWVHLFMCG